MNDEPKLLDDKGGILHSKSISPEEYERRRKERKSRSASYGHVSRQLGQGKVLKGKMLELALDAVGDGEIARKLQAGEMLGEYEMHLMLDMYLLHARLCT
jgi:hypothetical protein